MKGKIVASLLLLLMGCSVPGSSSLNNTGKKIENPTTNVPFVIVVASYNNEKYFLKNLESIFTQDYDNYRVIYVDDASTDKTYEEVKRYVDSHPISHKIDVIHNESNQKALYNLYTSIQTCKSNEIVVLLDGDDWFPHSHVLTDLNQYYADENVWMTYGQYIRFPDWQMGMCAPVTKKFLKNAEMRQGPWKYSHLRTFYAGLFKQIKMEDLTRNGQFYATTYDLAIMFPMLEMAREHAIFTPDISYIYNWENPITDQKIREAEQLDTEHYIRGLPIYSKLQEHPKRFPNEYSGAADLIVFSYNRPMQLYALLESTEKHVEGLRKIGVLYRADDSFEEGYKRIKERFPYVTFFEQPKVNPKSHFKSMLMEMMFGKFGKGAEYILFAVDDIIVTDHINLTKDIDMLSKTGVYGLYYRLGKNIKSCYMTGLFNHPTPKWINLGNDYYGWEFEGNQGDWNYPNSVDFNLFRKQDLKKPFEEIAFSYPNQLEGAWANRANLKRIGLCHGRTKTINIPMNIVNGHIGAVHEDSFSAEQLNSMFLSGLKINIQEFFQAEFESPHVGIIPEFVARLEE